MIKLLIAATLFVGPIAAQADWTKSLSGPAVYTNDEGETVDFDLAVELADGGTSLTLAESAWGGNFNFTVTDGKLFIGETEVGTVSADMISAKFQADDICVQTFTITSGDNITYVDDYSCDDGFYDHIEATLAPAKSANFNLSKLLRRR